VFICRHADAATRQGTAHTTATLAFFFCKTLDKGKRPWLEYPFVGAPARFVYAGCIVRLQHISFMKGSLS
jgi:hypothetical protein